MIDLNNTRNENDRNKIEEIINQMHTVVNSSGNNSDVLLAKQYDMFKSQYNECIAIGLSNIHDLTLNWQMMENDYRLVMNQEMK